jgi:hypothetical protein
MSFPCRELGGGGFILPVVEDVTSIPRKLSSRSDISCDVRGDSGSAPCIGSNIDCRDMDDASVLLPPSPSLWCRCAGGVPSVDTPSPAFPVKSSLLKASTSKDALPWFICFGGPVPSRTDCSIVSNVF